MGSKKLFYLSMAVLGVFIISGCGTSQKKVQSEVTGIKGRVETLETRLEGVESKQADVERMTAEQAQAIDELKTTGGSQANTNFSVKSRETARSGKTRDIQQALKNAGYYSGKIDGVKGKVTRRAIKEFQKANGLKADGVVGPRTWELLSGHLSAANAGATLAAVSGDEGIK